MRRSSPICLAALCAAATLPAQQARPVQDLSPGALTAVYGPAVASDMDLSAVMYKDGADGGVYVRVSDGHGLAWSPAVRIDSDGSGANKFVHSSSMAVEGDSIYCSWRDARLSTGATPQYDTWFAASHDRGATWSADQVLDKGHPHGPANTVYQARVAVDGGRVHVGQLVDNGGEEVWVVSSADSGATWTPALNASSSSADLDFFNLDASGGGVFVAWCDDRTAAGLDELWFRASLDGGLSWSGPEQQMDGSGAGVGDVEGAEILLLLNGNQTCLVWMEDELPSSPLQAELHFRFSPDRGATWGPDTVLMTGGDADNPSMSFCGCNVSIAWEDDRSGADEIYAAVSVDQGANWSENRLSSGGGAYPRIRGRADFQGVAWSSGAFPDAATMAVTRDEGQSWLPAFDLAGGAMSGDADFVELAFNEKYKNFVAAWLSDDSGVNHLYAGGLRTHAVVPQGNFTPGGTVSFAVEHFAIDEEGFAFAVPVAGGTGHYLLPFPGAYDIGLANDSFLQATLGMIPGPLTGVQSGGAGSTANVVIPPTLPVGTVLYAVAVSFSLPGPVIKSISDAVAVTVL